MMSQPKITTFANELLDKVFAYLVSKDDWLALCKTHRSFKASGQQLLFCDIQIPAQHTTGSPGRCSMLQRALTAAAHLADSVETLQIDCRLEGAFPYGDLVLERDAIRAILSRLRGLHLTVFVVEQPQVPSEQMRAAFEIAEM